MVESRLAFANTRFFSCVGSDLEIACSRAWPKSERLSVLLPYVEDVRSAREALHLLDAGDPLRILVDFAKPRLNAEFPSAKRRAPICPVGRNAVIGKPTVGCGLEQGGKQQAAETEQARRIGRFAYPLGKQMRGTTHFAPEALTGDRPRIGDELPVEYRPALSNESSATSVACVYPEWYYIAVINPFRD